MESEEGTRRLCWLAWRESPGKKWRCLARAPMGLMETVPRRERGGAGGILGRRAPRDPNRGGGVGGGATFLFFFDFGVAFCTRHTNTNFPTCHHFISLPPNKK